jgi:hypothetical protein
VADSRLDRMTEDLEQARGVSRDAVYRITLLSASIVAFSATAQSIDQINVRANETLLAISWCLFAAVVVIGPASIALEARAQYVVRWRAFQPQDFDRERKLTPTDRIKLLVILAYSLMIRPRSLFFARDTDYSEEKPTQGMWMNFRMVLLLHQIVDLALGFEILVWGLFSAAVIVLLVALLP